MGRLIYSIIGLAKAKLRKPTRRHTARFVLGLELLESRVCPSVYYDFNVIAKVGQSSLTNIEQGASINDAGKVAFVGDLASGQGIFVGDGTTLTNIDSTFVSPTRTLGTELQINNSNQIAVGDRLNGSGTAHASTTATPPIRSRTSPSAATHSCATPISTPLPARSVSPTTARSPLPVWTIRAGTFSKARAGSTEATRLR